MRAAWSRSIFRGLVESVGWTLSKDDVIARFEIDDREFDEWIEIELWALEHGAEEVSDLVREGGVLRYTVRNATPRLYIYFVLLNGTCELRWVEDE